MRFKFTFYEVMPKHQAIKNEFEDRKKKHF